PSHTATTTRSSSRRPACASTRSRRHRRSPPPRRSRSRSWCRYPRSGDRAAYGVRHVCVTSSHTPSCGVHPYSKHRSPHGTIGPSKQHPPTGQVQHTCPGEPVGLHVPVAPSQTSPGSPSVPNVAHVSVTNASRPSKQPERISQQRDKAGGRLLVLVDVVVVVVVAMGAQTRPSFFTTTTRLPNSSVAGRVVSCFGHFVL